MYSSQNNRYPLDDQSVYPCPICRLEQLKPMPLMEAMACDCCHHIFTSEPERQLIKLPTRQPPLIWRWNGRNWVGVHLEKTVGSWVNWLFAIAFVVLPTAIVGLAAYAFPATPGSNLSWLPVAWTGVVFATHLAIVGWLIIEFYQFPVWAYLRARRQQLLGR